MPLLSRQEYTKLVVYTACPGRVDIFGVREFPPVCLRGSAVGPSHVTPQRSSCCAFDIWCMLRTYRMDNSWEEGASLAGFPTGEPAEYARSYFTPIAL